MLIIIPMVLNVLEQFTIIQMFSNFHFMELKGPSPCSEKPKILQ
jgi:hypothetical protein